MGGVLIGVYINGAPVTAGEWRLRAVATLALGTQKALADWGAAFHYLAPWETPASSMARIDLAITS